MLIRYLKTVTLQKDEKVKQPNGEYVSQYTDIEDYRVKPQDLQSDVDAQVYGSNINKMLRLKSPGKKLEAYLLTKLNNKEDNISKYVIKVQDSIYKIVAVTLDKIDVERL